MKSLWIVLKNAVIAALCSCFFALPYLEQQWNIREAVKKAYAGVEKISFDGAHYRKDIAHRALERLN